VRFRAGVVALEVQDVERVASELQEHDEPVEAPELVHPDAGLTGSKVTAAVRRLQDLGVAEVLADGHVHATSDFDPTAVAIEAVESQDARRAYERSRIDMLRTYAELRDCRRRFLLEYFGEPHPDPCGNCDNCEAGLIAETTEEPFPLGARVRHAAWGVGTVQRYEEDRMVVLFDAEGYRTLDVDIALERRLLRPA
jgi:ATP-dependent DNA helicase RecQ